MRTYYTRRWDNGKLVAMVNANTYSEALTKTAGNKHSAMCRHTKDRYCEDPEGNKIPNYITFFYEDTMYFMYHK